jgi:hypothetical protein
VSPEASGELTTFVIVMPSFDSLIWPQAVGSLNGLVYTFYLGFLSMLLAMSLSSVRGPLNCEMGSVFVDVEVYMYHVLPYLSGVDDSTL